MNGRFAFAATCAFLAAAPLCHASERGAAIADEAPVPLWDHLRGAPGLVQSHGLDAAWDGDRLRLRTQKASRYARCALPPPRGGWDLSRRAAVEAAITNTDPVPVEVILWVVGSRGWDAVPAVATLGPGETRTFSCLLRDTYPDGTPKIDPGLVKQVEIMVTPRTAGPVSLEVSGLRAVGDAPAWVRPRGRIDVPDVGEGPPAPGRRVRFRLPEEEGSGLHSVLGLPVDWETGRLFPVVVEYPGNEFFTGGCYSTGLPDQCVIGHGMTGGEGAICLGLPFVEKEGGGIARSGWGDADATVNHALRMVEEVCGKFGGDRNQLVLTGFSRGAIACGYIGLRDERIAPLWKGFHACQHSDGGGWNGATLEGALERAKRFRGQSVFQTDNPRDVYEPVMKAMGADVIWEQSGLGAHATAMFLDDRPSTLRLRQWFRDLASP